MKRPNYNDAATDDFWNTVLYANIRPEEEHDPSISMNQILIAIEAQQEHTTMLSEHYFRPPEYIDVSHCW